MHDPSLADEFLELEPDWPYCRWPRCECREVTRCHVDEAFDKQIADARDCLAREMGR